MRIKDLPSATTTDGTDYIATDDAIKGTRKATLEDVAVAFAGSDDLAAGLITEREAATGSSSTDYILVYDPSDDAVYKATKSLFLAGVNNSITNLAKYECIRATTTAFSSLSQTFNAIGVTADMVVLGYSLSNPAAQTGAWTITTAADKFTVAGSISGSTTLTLVLAKPSDDVTATT